MKSTLQSNITFKNRISKRELEALFSFSEKEFQDKWSFESIQSYISQGHSKYSVAFENDEVIGFCFISVGKDQVAHLYQICVSPAKRGYSIGKNLVKHALKDFHGNDNSLESIYLEVRVNNDNAIAFYHKNGFEKLNIIKKFYSNGEDACAMQCSGDKLAKLLRFW